MNSAPVARHSADSIAALVRAFETATLAPADFTHHAHMTVALSYLWDLPYDAAVERMRRSVQSFAAHHGKEQLYNETITLFWMKLLHHALCECRSGRDLPQAVEEILQRWGSMQWLFRHYSRERAFSPAARRIWLEPDLLPLEFATQTHGTQVIRAR
ncbi:MAG: hypothetical protein QM718_09725 [Steroidobacteraceae bacterium]